MKKNRRGISLIVLSITILVMAILAATVIIALEDSGIIGRAKNTVTSQNYKEEYTRLQVIKNGILTDNLGEITVTEYVTELENKGLVESKTINADGSVTIKTISGFEVKVSQNGTSDIGIAIDGYTPPANNNTGNNTGNDNNNQNTGDSNGGNTPSAPSTGTITLNKSTISKTIKRGATATETITATTSNLTEPLVWKTTNSGVATISGSGTTATLTARGEGNAIITAQSGNITASCTVTVTESGVQGYTLSGVWVFNDVLNIENGVDFEQEIKFTSSNTIDMYGMRIQSLAIKSPIANYEYLLGYLEWGSYDYKYEDGWINEDNKTIDFGLTPQTVSAEFYNWFTANAVKQDVEIITFSIEGNTYQAEYGMTWEDWCNSSYNTTASNPAGTGIIVVYVYNGNVYFDAGGHMIGLRSNGWILQQATDQPALNGYYYKYDLTAGSGG